MGLGACSQIASETKYGARIIKKKLLLTFAALQEKASSIMQSWMQVCRKVTVLILCDIVYLLGYYYQYGSLHRAF